MYNGLSSLYRKRYYRGRSALARIMDYILLRLAIFLFAYVFMLFTLKDRQLSMFLSIVLVCLFSIASKVISNMRFESFADSLKKELSLTFASEKLLLMEQASYMEVCSNVLKRFGITMGEPLGNAALGVFDETSESVYIEGWQRHPSVQSTPQDIVEFYFRSRKQDAKSCVIISTGSFAEPAQDLLGRIGALKIKLLGIDDILKVCGTDEFLPTQEELEDMLQAEVEKEKAKKQSFLEIVLNKDKARRYALSGAILAAGSFITGYNLYYQIFSVLCFILSAICGFKGYQSKRQKAS